MLRYLITKKHMFNNLLTHDIKEYCVFRDKFEIIQYEKDSYKGLINKEVLSNILIQHPVCYYKKLFLPNNNYVLIYNDDINILHIQGDYDVQIKKVIEKSLLIEDKNMLKHENLIQDKYVKVIFEGCDYVGKTTLSKYCLENYGWAVQERDTENVSFFIRDYISQDVQSDIINKNIESNSNRFYIIMYTNNDLIQSRKNTRVHISEWDKIAEISNGFYKDLNIKAKNCVKLEVDKFEDSYVTLLRPPYFGVLHSFLNNRKNW